MRVYGDYLGTEVKEHSDGPWPHGFDTLTGLSGNTARPLQEIPS